MADLQQFLDNIKLSKYTEALAEYGAETTDDLIELNDDELADAADECGMKKLHKKKFIKGVKQLQNGGGNAQPEQQQQQQAPQQQQQAPPTQTQPQTQTQAQAPPKTDEKEEKLTEEEQIEERVEQLAMQNPELFAKLQDDGLMENYNYYIDNPDEPHSIQLEENEGFMEFVEQMDMLYEKARSGEVNPNALVKCSIEELSRENINAMRVKMGSLGFKMGDIVSANDDLIASNEFCQIAVGKRLFIEKDEDENAQGEEKPLPLGWIKAYTPDGREYYQHLVTQNIQWERPADEEEKGDDQYEADNGNDLVREPQPDIVHDGVMHTFMENGMLDLSGDASCPQVGFAPGTRNFTICCEVCCINTAVPNAIIANGLADFFIYNSKVAVRTTIHELTNIGNVKLIPNFWYHISIVCQRKQITIDDGKNKGKKIEATEFRIYMDGVEAGIISLNGISNLDANALIGRTWNEEIPNNFTGGIQNFKIFYRDLNDDEIFAVAQNPNNDSYKPTKMITYSPGSLKIELPRHVVKYNGPIHGKLPPHLSFTCTEAEALSITAYIMLRSANSKHGSVILTNRSFSFSGFELICPLPKTNVIGMKCDGTRDWDLISLGKTKFKLNRFYHIAVSISREDGDTRFVAYVNGEKDGSYNMDSTPSIGSSGDWDIGFRESKPIKTRFDGSIQNLRIFNYGLCEAEVASIYAADIRECTFMKNKTILYISPKGSNECAKCNTACDFTSKFCSKCRAPLKEISMLKFEKEQTDKNGPSQWAQAFNDAAQSYVEEEYGVTYQEPQQEQKTEEELQFEEQQQYERAITHETQFNFLEWEKGIFISKDMKKGTVTILNKDNKQKILMLNEIIKPESDIKDTIPATDALKIENIGGWILGVDFHGNKWKICTNESGFVKYLVTPSCFNQLTSLQRFPKHTFEQIINNPEIRDFYIANRLLYAAFELLKIQAEPYVDYATWTDPNGKWTQDQKSKKKKKEKRLWTHFNEYILPWTKIWMDKPDNDPSYEPTGECVCGAIMEKKPANTCYNEYPGIGCDQCGKTIDGDILVYHCNQQQTLQHEMGYDSCVECQKESNFLKLKTVSRKLQQKFANKNFALEKKLLTQNANWKLFSLQSGSDESFMQGKHMGKTIGPRQNYGFKGGMTIEIDVSKLDDANVDKYNKDIPTTKEHAYDKAVVTMLLWGRCKLLNCLFQTVLEDMFESCKTMDYSEGPIKTYERMKEKADEYRFEDLKPFPCSFSICDVNRCSIKCMTLDDVLDAFNMVKNSELFKIVRIKNRFAPTWDVKAAGGYRDMLVNVLFTDPRKGKNGSGLAVMAEIQFHLNEYEHIKHYQHKLYKIQRAQDQLSLWQNFEARKFDDKKKKKKKKENLMIRKRKLGI